MGVAARADNHAHEVVAGVLINRDVNLLLDLTVKRSKRRGDHGNSVNITKT